jgi:hypothetical protein
MVLDSGLVHSHESQKEFIKNNYEELNNDDYKLVMYNIPLYPSVSNFEWKLSSMGRDEWESLFQQYNVSFAFEGHDRIYKKTFPIGNEGTPQQNGIIYVGDGSMNVELPNTLNEQSEEFMEMTELIHNYQIVQCSPINGIEIKVFNSDSNELIDTIIKKN